MDIPPLPLAPCFPVSPVPNLANASFLLLFFFLLLLLSNPYAQCGTQTHDPENKSHMLYCLSQPARSQPAS